MAAHIPVISFAPFLGGTKAQRHAVARQIYDASTTVGFIYLKDHGISESSVERIFLESKRFFELSKEQKLQYALTDAAVNQGYTADGAEGIGDHKECYEHRRFSNIHCPDNHVLPDFRTNVDAFFDQCLTLALEVLKCLAIMMNLEEDFFDRITTKADPQLRLLHYPAIHRTEIEKPGHSRITAHTDFGLCTLLFQDDIGGLEIDPFRTGHFTPAPPVPGTVLVNIGDLLQRYTNGRVKSTLHRVVSPRTQRRDSGIGGVEGQDGRSASNEMLPPRYSIPFFVHPDPETLIDPIVLEEGEVKKYKPVIAKEWRDYNTRRNYGFDGKQKTSLTRADEDVDVDVS